MKFTRFFILKVLTHKHISANPAEASFIEAFKQVFINHPYVDMMISLLLTMIILFTKFNDNNDLINIESVNFFLIVKLNLGTLVYYFFAEHLDSLDINDITMPRVFMDYYHTYKGILYLVKNVLCITSYLLSLIFCYIYGYQKLTINKEEVSSAHILILEFYNFYCAFRFCYFLVKIIINICLIPLYVTSVLLGYTEDNFNKQLNTIVNTQQYRGRSSISSNGRLSEIDESCSICLISFNIDDYTSTLPCSRRHTFHTKCLEKWFLTTVTCPLCRSDFHNNIDLSINNNDNRILNDLNQRLL
jgi:hypothetical protein